MKSIQVHFQKIEEPKNKKNGKEKNYNNNDKYKIKKSRQTKLGEPKNCMQ